MADGLRRCARGHGIPVGARFCAQCGLPPAPASGDWAKREGLPPRAGNLRWVIPVLGGLTALLAVLAVAVLLMIRGPSGSDQDTTASLPPAQRQCQETVTRWVDAIAADQANFGQAAFELGTESREFKLITRALQAYVANAYRQGASQAAAEVYSQVVVPGCEAIVTPAAGLPRTVQTATSTTTAAKATTTTACVGVSACAFDNGIDFNALNRAIRSEVRRKGGGELDEVDCDSPNRTPPNHVPVGQQFRCTSMAGGPVGVSVVTVTSQPPYYRLSDVTVNQGD